MPGDKANKVANYYAHDFARDNYVSEPGICLHLTRPSIKEAEGVWSGDETRASNNMTCLDFYASVGGATRHTVI